MDDILKSGIKKALMWSNLSTYEIAKVFKVSNEEVLDIMKELDLVVT